MIVIICGGSDFRDRAKLYESLDYWHARLGFTLLIQGGKVSTSIDKREQWGTDYFAKCWAVERGVPWGEEPVNMDEWKRTGAGAVETRNKRMIQRFRVERVIDFGDPELCKLARFAGIKVIEVA